MSCNPTVLIILAVLGEDFTKVFHDLKIHMDFMFCSKALEFLKTRDESSNLIEKRLNKYRNLRIPKRKATPSYGSVITYSTDRKLAFNSMTFPSMYNACFLYYFSRRNYFSLCRRISLELFLSLRWKYWWRIFNFKRWLNDKNLEFTVGTFDNVVSPFLDIKS